MKDYCGEKISANYFVGIEAVGGKIHFEECGFKFISHAFNIQTGEMRIEYNKILKVKKWNPIKIIPTGISITTEDGFEHKFIIYHRKKVIAFLENKM